MTKVVGYRTLSDEQVKLMNEFKAVGAELGVLINKLQGRNDIDGRWLNIGKTDCQKGIMSLVRAVAQPDNF